VGDGEGFVFLQRFSTNSIIVNSVCIEFDFIFVEFDSNLPEFDSNWIEFDSERADSYSLK
jgi:hypothetical protein